MDRPVSFIILTNGRSSSNYFVNLLNQHPAALNYGEVLGEWTEAWKARRLLGAGDDGPAAVKRYLDGFFDSPMRFYAAQAAAAPARIKRGQRLNFKRRGSVTAIGIKDFHLNFERRNVVDYIGQRPGMRVIGLVRKNPVRRFVSSAMLDHTGQAAARSGEKAVFQPLDISPDEFLKGARTVAGENARLEATLASFDSARRVVIDYVDYFSDEEAMRAANYAMFSLLGLEPLDLKSEHRKLNARPMRETLANYDEVAKVMASSELAGAFAEAELGG